MARLSDGNLLKVFLWRWLLMALLVVCTYNPTPASLVSFLWSQVGTDQIFVGGAFKLIALLAFGILWWIVLRATFVSLKGMAVAIGFILLLGAYIVFQKVDEMGYGISNAALIWTALFIGSFLLAMGSSASIFKMRWSGIRNVDDVDPN